MILRQNWNRRFFLRGMAGASLAALIARWAGANSAWADQAPMDFAGALDRARGETVYFNAWAGDQKINNFILWVAEELERRHGIGLKHVKLSDTGEAVARILAEKAAGRNTGGSADLIWINGENFAAMKAHGLLFGPFTQLLPNFGLVDPQRNPTLVSDFTVPTAGLESPWGMAQFTFFHDSARVPSPPRDMKALRDWAAAHPGRFTYPAPPDFIGTTFLKQVLYALTDDATILLRPAAQDVVDRVTTPLWDYLTDLHPHLWRNGKAFPASGTAQRQLLNDGEVDFYMAFNPGDASSAIAQHLLPETVRGYVPTQGSIANTHFVAIPFNANAPAAAMVAADFLLSPEAQARKQDPAIWGDPTVLALDRLSRADRAVFDRLPHGIATPQDMGRALEEPHPSWVEALEHRWAERYAS